jgi:surface polysaccharide O-acyltransferase-like enzyme
MLTSRSNLNSKSRNPNIDAGKAIAAFSVLLIHFCPFPEPYFSPIQLAIRFAVPFFFMLNGYFFSLGASKHGLKLQTISSFRKISAVYLVWWWIYILFPSSGEIRKLGFYGSYEHRFNKVMSGFESFIFYGPTTHLWYFPALLCAIGSTFLVLRFIKHEYIQWMIAFTLYSAGVLGGSYSASNFGITLPVNARHAAFFSFLPFLTNHLLFVKKKKEKKRTQLLPFQSPACLFWLVPPRPPFSSLFPPFSPFPFPFPASRCVCVSERFF